MGIGLLLAAQQLGTIPGENLLSRTLSNSLHIPWFALMALLIWYLFAGHGALWVLGIASAVAVVSEALQIPTGRDASWLDLGLDLIGAGLASLGIALHVRNRDRPTRRRAGWAAILMLTLVVTLTAPAGIWLAYQERDRLFPRLFIADSWLLRPLAVSNSPARRIAAPREWSAYAGRTVLELRWADTRYPGIELQEVVGDWRCCRHLVMELYVPGAEPLPVTAAVGHAGIRGTARYVPTVVAPGAHRIEIPLEKLGAVGDNARTITRLIVHTSRRYAGRRLLIADIYLR
ncbi:MAG: hypothetical protein Kow006_19310 [Gammaproteobacteria bacterium]